MKLSREQLKDIVRECIEEQGIIDESVKFTKKAIWQIYILCI